MDTARDTKVEREGAILWFLPTPHPNLSSGLPLAESSQIQASLGNVVCRGPALKQSRAGEGWRRDLRAHRPMSTT